MKPIAYAIAGLMLSAMPTVSYAEGRPVPTVNFLTWPASKYQHYYETTSYVAEAWRKLGIDVELNAQPFPSPMMSLWFTEHKFDVVMSVLSGSLARLDPEFFGASQFATANSSPGGMNVGSFSSAKVDALIDEQRRIYDPEKRRKVVYELQALVQDEQPEGLIASPVNTTAINVNNVALEGYENSPDGIRSVWNMIRIVPKKSGPVKLGWTIDQGSWNPLTFKTGEEMDRLALVYDRLFAIGIDGNPVKWAADQMTVVNDTTIDVTLKQGLTFTDGKPLTAEDVRFSYQFLKDNNAVYFKSSLDTLDAVSAEGSAIRFKLKKPSVQFISNALSQVPILPKHIWETIAEQKGLAKPHDYKNTDIVGSGPYRLKYWKEGQEIYFERRPDHFLKPPADLLMVQFGSGEVLAASLRKGEVDVTLQGLVPTVVSEFAKDKNLKLLPAKSNGYMSARYNLKTELFSHKAVRQALAHAIPYEAIIEEVLGGGAEATPSPIVPANTFWSNPDLKIPEYNLDKARAILKEAGFTWDSKGRLLFPK